MDFNFNRKRKKSLIRNILEWVFTIFIAVAISLFIVSNVVSLTQIKEQSMETTFQENDRALVNRFGYYFEKPKRGDIVIVHKKINQRGIIINMVNEAKDIMDNVKYRFTNVIEKNNLIKRVIGVEGDIIDIKDGYIYLNGNKQEEEYVNGMTYPGGAISYPIEVPAGKVFVLGDNRERSSDSRDLGFMDINQLKGKVTLRVAPLSKFGKVN